MVEFWIDPDSPYFKQQFGTAQKLLFHCAADGRSMLIVHTVTQMGVEHSLSSGRGSKGLGRTPAVPSRARCDGRPKDMF